MPFRTINEHGKLYIVSETEAIFMSIDTMVKEVMLKDLQTKYISEHAYQPDRLLSIKRLFNKRRLVKNESPKHKQKLA